jgi:hypothetical protein
VMSSTNGSQGAPSYGFTANVCSSCISASHFLIAPALVAGSGKSILWFVPIQLIPPRMLMSSISSTIIENVTVLCDAESASLAYFYCDFRDAKKQSRPNILPSLLIQLSSRSTPCCDILSQLYLAHDSGAQKPSDAILTQCLKDMLVILDSDPTYIIIDALDECPDTFGIPSAREQVLTLMKELVNLRLENLHICVTSRPETDIRAVLEPLALHSVCLHNQSGQKQDIVDYIQSVVYSDSETMMRRWKEEDKALVIKTLSERAGGM